ncbi:MAG: hypothetical protein COT88_02240 [Candidatus Colwellbacteria bacterium CG10_big_fil_rev_8_21_14_0_10_41_28]|uniref:Uncharacterized protein n=1 Tax=Candidatus Colwellbacteria bacterium CG10_big_fil_rev_8_21_14_0_10_41_28 TaxID=1974539 RepID=A0A2H0VGW3_9BACT|nr:MAG: hypothetical protein COT88_02240 [Candidatus Colwellbacteria bacterium CG10_big_fil_rev_8_21_14_0_10_41_28]
MNEQQLIKQLNSLKEIRPDEGFASTLKAQLAIEEMDSSRFYLLSQSLVSSFSVGVAILLFIFIALGGVANTLKGPLFPTLEGVDKNTLASEASDIQNKIDKSINDVDYLSEDRKLARANISDTSYESSEDEEIDQLLEDAISY